MNRGDTLPEVFEILAGLLRSCLHTHFRQQVPEVIGQLGILREQLVWGLLSGVHRARSIGPTMIWSTAMGSSHPARATGTGHATRAAPLGIRCRSEEQ